MKTIYNTQIMDAAVERRIHTLTNQIYKLLPEREEGHDWKRPLATIIEQLAGMGQLFDNHDNLLPLLSKLQGLNSLTTAEDFMEYRRIIFECLSIIGRVIGDVRVK